MLRLPLNLNTVADVTLQSTVRLEAGLISGAPSVSGLFHLHLCLLKNILPRGSGEPPTPKSHRPAGPEHLQLSNTTSPVQTKVPLEVSTVWKIKQPPRPDWKKKKKGAESYRNQLQRRRLTLDRWHLGTNALQSLSS